MTTETSERSNRFSWLSTFTTEDLIIMSLLAALGLGTKQVVGPVLKAIIAAFLIPGGVIAGGFYMMLRRNVFKLIIGLGLVGHAANLLIFTVGRMTRGTPPLIQHGEDIMDTPFADPLPQALILTAIVIGFGVQAFALVLLKRAYHTTGEDDLDRYNSTDS